MTNEAPVPLAEQIAAVSAAIREIETTVPFFEEDGRQLTRLRAALAILQQHERLQADYQDTLTCLTNERRMFVEKVHQLDDENQRFMREVAGLRQQHERAMAALREPSDAVIEAGRRAVMLATNCHLNDECPDCPKRDKASCREIVRVALLAALDDAASAAVTTEEDKDLGETRC